MRSRVKTCNLALEHLSRQRVGTRAMPTDSVVDYPDRHRMIRIKPGVSFSCKIDFLDRDSRVPVPVRARKEYKTVVSVPVH